MRQSLIVLCLAVALVTSPGSVAARSQRSAATDGQRPAEANPGTQEFSGPIQLFDDLYYVETDFVSAYVLVTSDGLVMFDSLYNQSPPRRWKPWKGSVWTLNASDTSS